MAESKSRIKDFKRGIVCCPSCHAELSLNAYDPLDVTSCSSCNTPVFVPMKIRHYWLYRPLGGGGMGCVYRALSEEESGEFAIKILPRKKKNDKDLIKTLMMEGEIGTILGKSPHIIEVVDYGCDNDEHYMVSRFVAGTRLDIFISSASRLSERQALDIMIQILDAEIHIKNCGYLFRDMKPENIMIIEKTAIVKLFDFGLCMSLEQAANPNPEDQLEGSPYYLPPERIVAAPEGEYSEIYSLGMLLFHMLTGTTYFSPADIRELVTKHVRSTKMVSVSTRMKHCSEEIVNLIDKMIQGDPNKRYHSLSEVADIIKNLSKDVAGYPLLSNSKRPHKIEIKPRRSQGAGAIAVKLIVVIALIGGIAFAWYYYQQLEEDAKVKALTLKAAAELNIPADIRQPALSRNQIREIIAQKISEQIGLKTEESEVSEDEIRNSIESQIYKNNGYIYYNGEWVPAKKLLDDAVKQKMERMR